MITRRRFAKLLCMAMPAIFAPWPPVIDTLAYSLDYHAGPMHLSMDRYFKEGMNLVLEPHGIYVSKVESIRDEAHFGQIIRGLAYSIYPVDEGDLYVTKLPEAKYFAFTLDHEAIYHVEVRQEALRRAINSILKAFGKRYI